jgi:hypothetical protein
MFLPVIRPAGMLAAGAADPAGQVSGFELRQTKQLPGPGRHARGVSGQQVQHTARRAEHQSPYVSVVSTTKTSPVRNVNVGPADTRSRISTTANPASERSNILVRYIAIVGFPYSWLQNPGRR